MCNYNNSIGNNACKLFFVLQLILMSNLIDIYCTYFISKSINSQTEVARSIIGENAYISRKKYVDHTYILCFVSYRPIILNGILCLGSLDLDYMVLRKTFLLFRDNGISVQLMKYQMYTEIFVFTLVIFFLVFLPVQKDIFILIQILSTFMTFVIQPLFYLSGDVNFRNRVLHKGLWLAIKTELFPTPNTVEPVS